jgi:hypothetical protein
MNRSISKIRHIQEANILLEKRLLNEQATPNTWLSYPNDKNYQYQKQGDKWMGKNVKTGKVIDLAKYPTTIQKLEKQFPGGKAPAGTTPEGGKAPDGTTPEGGATPGGTTTTTTTASTQSNNVSTVNAKVGGEGKIEELVGNRNLDLTKSEKPTITTVGALVPFKFEGFTNNSTTPITIKQFNGDTDLVNSDLKVPMILQPKQSTGPFQVFVKVEDLANDDLGRQYTKNQSINDKLDVAGPLKMKMKLYGYDLFGKLYLYGNDNTFITLTFKKSIQVKR